MIRKAVYIVLIFVTGLSGYNSSATSQTLDDTVGIRQAILQYEDPDFLLILKGRKMILDNFIEGDLEEVDKLLQYFELDVAKGYMALWPIERWLLYYWTKDYYDLFFELAHIDSLYRNVYSLQIDPPRDFLFYRVREKSRDRMGHLENSIQASPYLTEGDKLFASLVLKYCTQGSGYPMVNQDTLNKYANLYLKKYPETDYEDFIRQYIRYEISSSKWGFAFEFFTGFGMFSESLDQYFGNHVPVGVAFDVAYRKWILYGRDYIGIGRTQQQMTDGEALLPNHERINIFLPELSLGYALFENHSIKVSPFIGFSALEIGATSLAEEEHPEYENFKLKLTRTFSLGMNVDWKIKTRQPYTERAMEEGYPFIRIRFGYNQPADINRFAGYPGELYYITLGFGGFSRRMKRDL